MWSPFRRSPIGRYRSGGRCWSESGFRTSGRPWTPPTPIAIPRRGGAPAWCWDRPRHFGDPSATLPVPWAETAVAAVAVTAHGPVEIHCLHVPNAANGWVKPHTLQAVRTGLENAPPVARVVCGDLNTPRRELASGEVVSFARDSRGRLRAERGSEWDEAELRVVPGLSDLGYRDAYRSLHGYGSREPSWTWQRISGHAGGWRLDHLFTSAELEPAACAYHHAWRDEGLSDHSALEVDVARSAVEPPQRR